MCWYTQLQLTNEPALQVDMTLPELANRQWDGWGLGCVCLQLMCCSSFESSYFKLDFLILTLNCVDL